MKKIDKRVRFLIITIIVFLISLIMLQSTITSGFKVEQREVDIYTDEEVNLSGTLYVPDNATNESPAAAILVAPGGNTPRTFYSSYCIELSRRGYVVFSYDYYGSVKSDYSVDGNSGATAAMKYLTSLSFVDKNRLGATGHSNGGAQASAAITSEYAADAEEKSVFFIGCGIPSEDLSVYEDINLGVIWGKLDEAGQGMFWDTAHEDALNFGSFASLIGEESSEVNVAEWYEDGETGAKRIVFTPNTFHSLSNIMPECVTDIVSFFDNTLDGNVTDLTPENHIYGWEELAVLLMAISLCVMIFPVGALVLESGFFKSVKRPLPEIHTKTNAKFWIFLLVPAILQALIVETTIMQGQDLMGLLPNVFQVQSTNGFVWWFFLSALIAVGFYIVRMFIDKSVDRKEAAARLKTSASGIGKALIFGIIAVGVPYLFAALASELTGGWFGRLFQTYFAPVGANRVAMIPLYVIMFGILFSVYAWVQADSYRFKSEKKSNIFTFLANALPALIFVAYIFIRLMITHVTPISGRAMSRANSTMLGMVLMYFVIAKVVTYFYKKTGNIYICAMVNTMFVVWLSVNTQQLIF